MVDGARFDCSEKLFQVMKFVDADSRRAVYEAKGQTMKMKAKHRERVGEVRPDWGTIIVDAQPGPFHRRRPDHLPQEEPRYLGRETIG